MEEGTKTVPEDIGKTERPLESICNTEVKIGQREAKRLEMPIGGSKERVWGKGLQGGRRGIR